MLKGVQKKIIFVKLSGNKTFESAYFIMRDANVPTVDKRTDMVKEANKIVSGALPEKGGQGRTWLRVLILVISVTLAAILGRLSWFVF